MAGIDARARFGLCGEPVQKSIKAFALRDVALTIRAAARKQDARLADLLSRADFPCDRLEPIEKERDPFARRLALAALEINDAIR